MVNEERNKAITEWKRLLGSKFVLDKKEASVKYSSTTLGGEEKQISGALFPKNKQDVIDIVKIAARYKVPLFPISTGKNWGFGSASPVTENCVILDLSKMNNIIAVDKKLGLVTVEPGVTTKQLRAYLKEYRLPFSAPKIGVSNNVSILGNMLDRGSSMTRYHDRFSSMVSLEAILADGSLYHSAFSNVSKDHTPNFFKWGVGPYIDGLFGQSNLGVVTSVTVALASLPEKIEAFFFFVKKGDSLGSVIESLRESSHMLGSLSPTIRIYNTQRIVSSLKNPEDIQRKGYSAYISETSWLFEGIIQGNEDIVCTVHKIIKKIYKQPHRFIFFFNKKTFPVIRKIQQYIPRRFRVPLIFLDWVNVHIQSFSNEISHRELEETDDFLISNVLEKSKVSIHDPLCGLIFFYAVVPMIGEKAESFLLHIERICCKHDVIPYITLHDFSDNCILLTLRIIFNKKDKAQTKNAHACYEEIFKSAPNHDALPCRIPIDKMDFAIDPQNPFWKLAEKIKKALDPDNIISPGRYSSYKGNDFDENLL